MSILLRDATPDEIERLNLLLPRWQFRSGDQFVVAEADSPRRLVGGVVLGVRSRANETPGGQMDLVVFPRFRETDLLEQLVETALERGRLLHLSKLELLTPQEEGTVELGVLQRSGFVENRRLAGYEFSVAAFAARSRSVYERLVRHEALPSEAEVVPLAARHWPDAVRLLVSEKLVDAHLLEEVRRDGLAASFCPSSRLLLVHGEVKGVFLTRSWGRYSEVMALAVTPELRGGNSWANALLCFHSAAVAADLGKEVYTLWADPVRHPMSTRTARRMGSSAKNAKILLQWEARPL